MTHGSDAFAQLVLSLQDLTRMVERGIYDLSVWVSGMKMLPPARDIPQCFLRLGFDRIPEGPEEVRARYRALAKKLHPDGGWDDRDFKALQEASEEALKWFESRMAGPPQF